MNNEIELKYDIDSVTKGFEILSSDLLDEYKINGSNKSINMKAIYFDDNNHTLTKNKIGYRIRKENDEFIATIKHSAKPAQGGFSKRAEYNIPVNGEASHPEDFNEIIEDKKIAKILSTTKLQPMFTTEFTRNLVLVKYENSEIEVAFDSGQIYSHKNSVQICELECELKSGNEDALINFGHILEKNFSISPLNLSKLKRGLNLI